MEKLTIPPSPNWYEPDVLACAPDDTVIYGSRADIVIIIPSKTDECDHVEVIPRAHSARVNTVNINPNWRIGYKNAVTVSEDKIIKTWDMEAYVQTACHNKHANEEEKVIGASYIGDNNIISVTEKGKIIMWDILTNNFKNLDFLKNLKLTFTCFSLCPHNKLLVAFGSRYGLIILGNIKNRGEIIYKLRTDDKPILSLSWCPVPKNIFLRNIVEIEKKTLKVNIEKEKEPVNDTFETNSITNESVNTEATSDIDDIIPYCTDEENKNKKNESDNETTNGLSSEIEKADVPVETCLEEKNANGILNPENAEVDQELIELPEQPEQEEVLDDKRIDNDESKNEMPEEFLLASSSNNSKVTIWRVSDGLIQTGFIVHSKQKRNNYHQRTYIQLSTVLCWITPEILLYSTSDAELFMCNFHNKKRQILIHNDHRMVLFSIKSAAIYLNDFNNDTLPITAWTIGKDRYIINVNIKTHSTIRCYPTLGNNVTCFCGSVLDPNRLAIVSSDGIIFNWDLSAPNKKTVVFDILYFIKKFNAITTVAWNPENDMLLAWGTAEGQIGVFNSGNNSNKSLNQRFKSAIHKIEWGPLKNRNDKGLYVIGDGVVTVIDPKGSPAEILLEIQHDNPVYTMAWKLDFSLLLIAPKSDTLISYTPTDSTTHVYYIPQRINSIVWHPDATTDDLQISKYCQMFIAICKSEINVYNLAIESKYFGDKIVAQYKQWDSDAHVTSVAWSPHCANHLVLVDVKSVAQVFDIESKSIISTYINPFCDSFNPVYWSPVHSDYIIGGLQGNKIVIWKVSENAPLTASEIKEKRDQRLAVLSNAVNNNFCKSKDKSKSTPQTNPVETITTISSSSKSIISVFWRHTDFFVADIKEMLKDIKENGNTKPLNDNLFFGPSSDLENIFHSNMNHWKRAGNYETSTVLSLFKGNLNETIKDAIKHKKLNPAMIAMCPMVSPDLWKTASEAYCNQLKEQPTADPLELVTYLLICHRVEEAVNILCEKTLFREAFLLARTRFGIDSDMLKVVLEKWAHYFVGCGNFERAALCFMALQKYESAASALLKRSDLELIQIAVDLAALSKNTEFYRAALLKFLSVKFTDGNEGEQADNQLIIEQDLLKELDSEIDMKLENGSIVHEVNEESQDNKITEVPDAVGIKSIMIGKDENNNKISNHFRFIVPIPKKVSSLLCIGSDVFFLLLLLPSGNTPKQMPNSLEQNRVLLPDLYSTHCKIPKNICAKFEGCRYSLEKAFAASVNIQTNIFKIIYIYDDDKIE